MYIPMARGFVYLIAIVDRFSRRVLSWRLSITLETDFRSEVLEEALARFGAPEIFNTDRGSRFTGMAFTAVLHHEKIAISTDGRGAWRDDVFVERLWHSAKYEEARSFAEWRRLSEQGRRPEIGKATAIRCAFAVTALAHSLCQTPD